MRLLVERLTPWLLDLGAWVLGAMVAFDVILIGASLPFGAADAAALIGTAALALALPPAVAGFVLLRMVAETKTLDIEMTAMTAFQEAGFEMGPSPDESPEARERRRQRTVLRSSYLFLGLTAALDLAGLTALLWHVAWWIGVGFAAMAVGCLLVAIQTMIAAGAQATWRAPEDTSGSVEDSPERGREG